jgi:hypothetical protein
LSITAIHIHQYSNNKKDIIASELIEEDTLQADSLEQLYKMLDEKFYMQYYHKFNHNEYYTKWMIGTKFARWYRSCIKINIGG